LRFARPRAKFKRVSAHPAPLPVPDFDPLSPERRQRIVAGAAAIFIRDGYEGASMSQIAAAASVSKGTLYNYFPSKQALFAAFVRQGCARLVEEIFGATEDDDGAGDAHAQLLRIGRAMLRMMVSADARAVYRVVVMEASKFPELAQAFVDSGPKILVGHMADWLTRQILAGRLSAPDPVFAAEQFFALTQARIVPRARTNADYLASDQEIDFVVQGAVRVFLAAYGRP
jgi:AcrR family transcriptional regulator